MLSKLFWSLRFAVSEIRGEWLFGLGVAMAVCSVMTPTALLWGTKTGMIDTMRNDMLRDPVVRELIGQEDAPLSSRWFEKMRSDPRVAFVIPSVRRISLSGNVSVSGESKKSVEISFLPTAAGDPVGGGIEWNVEKPQVPIPCMITSMVAEEIGVGLAGRISLELSRSEGGKPVKLMLESKIQRILAPHESDAKAVFLPLAVLERIEDYRDGQAVPLFGCRKSEVDSMRIYDSIRFNLKNTENKEGLAEAIRKLSGFNDILVTGDPAEGNFGVASSGDGIDQPEMLGIVRTFSAFVPRIRLQAEARITDDPVDKGSASSGLLLTGDESNWLTQKEVEDLDTSLEFMADSLALRSFRIICEDGRSSYIKIPVPGDLAGKQVVQLPANLTGVIGAAKRRPVEFNAATGEFRPLRDEYPGFRLYAKELEDVKALRLLCGEQGIQVTSNEDRIQNVLYLDNALGKFLAFIVVAGGLGGIGALFTSLYLSIERSRRQFSVLQILGIPRLYVFLSTVFQAVFMVLAGVLASFVFFHIGAFLLSSILAPGQTVDSPVCALGFGQWCTLSGAAVLCAILSASMALKRLQFNDPALIARSE
jgi:putative ABC transport system permease protein